MVHLARQGMIKALANNRQINEAQDLLAENEMNLTEQGLFDDAKEVIQDIQKKIEKGQ